MKNIILLIAVFIFYSLTVNAQCPSGDEDGDLRIETQEEIDNFIIDYPNCTEFQGSVIIEENETGIITNVNSFENLTSIGEILVVINNMNLTNLNGFTNLTKVGGVRTCLEGLCSVS